MSEDDLRDWNLVSARDVALLAAKTLITLNSGAFVVLLTFIGNSKIGTQFVVPLQALKCSLSLFLIGIGGVFAAFVISYLSSAPHPSSPVARFFETKVITLNAICAVVSLFAFLLGVATIICNVEASV